MLPRVSAALAQFVAPIKSSSIQSSVESEKRKQEHKQKKKQEPPLKEQTLAKIIKLPLPGAAEAAPIAKQPGALPPAGVTSALLQLMTVLQEQRASIMRWLAGSVYQSAARMQKKNGRCRKGTILDHKAE